MLLCLQTMLQPMYIAAQAEETLPELKEETQEEDPFAGLFTQGGK